jgi:hypothetical protein
MTTCVAAEQHFLDPISLIGDDRWRSDGRPTPRPLARCCCTGAPADTVGGLACFVSSRAQVALAPGKRAVGESMCGATVATTAQKVDGVAA